MPGKSLIVSLHDAHPGSHRQIAEQVEFLAVYGIMRSSILVVPEFHHEGSVLRDAAFARTSPAGRRRAMSWSFTATTTTERNRRPSG